LKTVKDLLRHGQFTAWLAAEFGLSERAARNYMVAAEWAAGKTATVSVLQPTTVYALGAPSTPETVKVGVLERLESGEAVSDREVKSLIIQAKAERKAAEEERRQANEARRREADKARLSARQKRSRAQREA
jgi:ATPase subunit of ABC transporter with duplicated ATPase domains